MGADNHQWLWSRFLDLQRAASDPLVALDFGCGDGRLITWSHQQGVGDWRGVDTFYGDGAAALENGAGADVPAATSARISITAPGGQLPFPDATFDFVCSNQVFEHVQDVDAAVAELARVTKPSGVHLHLFPTRERLVEGHLGVPGIHRLRPDRRRAWARRWYPHVRYGDQTSSFEQWWDEMGPFLTDHTVYRSARHYDRTFARHFDIRHVEASKLAFHLQHSHLRHVAALGQAVPKRVELWRATSAVELTPRTAHDKDVAVSSAAIVAATS